MPNPGAESLITDSTGGRPEVAVSIEGPRGPVGPSGLSDLVDILEPGEALSIDETGEPVGVDAATTGDVGAVSAAAAAAAQAAATAQAKADAAATPAQVAVVQTAANAAQAKADAAATPAQVSSAVAPKADKTATPVVTNDVLYRPDGTTPLPVASPTDVAARVPKGSLMFSVADYATADPTGTADSTAAVQAAVDAAVASGAGSAIVFFPPGRWKLNALHLGSLASPGGRPFVVRGAGQLATTLIPASPTNPILTWSGSWDSSVDGAVIEDLSLELTANRAYTAPLLVIEGTRNMVFSRVRMFAGAGLGFTGLFVRFGAAYQIAWRDSSWYVKKYAVPLEIDNSPINPNRGVAETCDTWTFENILIAGCGPLTMRKTETAGNMHGVRLQQFKATNSTYYSSFDIPSPSVLAGAHAAGSAALTVADGSTYVTGDSVTIGTANTMEFNKVVAVAGSVLTLAYPTRFPQVDKAPIIRGGMAFSAGSVDNISGEVLHWEGHWCAMMVGNCRTLNLESVFQTTGYGIAAVGSMIGWRLGAHYCTGSTVANRPLYTPSSTWGINTGGTIVTQDVMYAGPFETPATPLSALAVFPSAGNPMWNGSLWGVVPSNGALSQRTHVPSKVTNRLDKVLRITEDSGVNDLAYTQGNGKSMMQGRGLARVAVNDAAYVVGKDDPGLIAMVTLTAARQITLPSAANWGPFEIMVKDESGTAGTRTITVAKGGASDTIDGALTATITTNYGVLRLYCDGVSKWFTF